MGLSFRSSGYIFLCFPVQAGNTLRTESGDPRCCFSISYLEPILQKKELKLLDLLSNYSYEIFLVHHIVIYVLTPASIPYLRGSWSVSILFAVELVFIAFFAFILKWLSGRCIAFLSRRSVNSNVK